MVKYFWKKISDESLFDCKYFDEAFLVTYQKDKGVVIKIKQKKITEMVIYIHDNWTV